MFVSEHNKIDGQTKVSVLIPVYNTEKHLSACLASVVNQTMLDIEIICVEDGSTDNSKVILNGFASKDSRFRIIYHEKNEGLLKTRKDAAMIAQGKYIMFLDSDDILFPDACEKAYSEIESKKTDVVQFGVEVFNVPEASGAMPYFEVRDIDVLEDTNLLYLWIDGKIRNWMIGNKIYRTDLCKRAFQYVEDIYMVMGEDLYFTVCFRYFARSFSMITDVLYKYRWGSGIWGSNQGRIDLEPYKVLLSEKKSLDAIIRFIQKLPDREFYQSLVQRIYNKFLSDSVAWWGNNLAINFRSEGFQCLVDIYGFKDVLCRLAETNWEIGEKSGESISNISFFHSITERNKKLSIAAYYPRIANGGAEQVVAMLCNRWAAMTDENGCNLYNVLLVTDEEKLNDEYELDSKVHRTFIPAIEESKKCNFKKRYEAWEKIIAEYDIDIVVDSAWVNPVTYWDMLAIKGQPNKPAFVIHSHTFCAAPYGWSGNTALRLIYQYMLCDGVVVLSECDKFFANAFNGRVSYIPNPIAFNPENCPLSSHQDNTIIWVGRISDEKQPLDVIKMMKLVVKKIPNAKLFIVGKHKEVLENRMKILIDEYGLQNNIKMTGFTLDVKQYYEIASVMVCTSQREGFSLTFAEAMAFGVPVVTYDMPWLTFIQDGRGIITVPQNCYDLLADKVVGLLLDKKRLRKIGSLGKEQISEIENYNNIENKWKELFETIGESGSVFCEDDIEESRLEKDSSYLPIILKYITLFQKIGKDTAVSQEAEKRRKIERELKACKERLVKIKNASTLFSDSNILQLQKYVTARIDIKNFGTEENSIMIENNSDHDIKVQTPAWFKNEQGQGVVIQSTKGTLKLVIKCMGSGELKISLRGVDCRDKNNNRFPVWIDYTQMYINDEIIFANSHVVCHDKPFTYKMNVANGERVQLDIEWKAINSESHYVT